MPKYGEENVKCSDAQRLALWQMFPLVGASTLSILWLPCPAMASCWSIPWLLIQDFHMRNLLCVGEFVIPYVVLIRCSDLAKMTPKPENWEISSGVVLSCGCYSTVFRSDSAFPQWNSTLSLLSKICQGRFIFYI